MRSFTQFMESKYLDNIKNQFGVQKHLWMGMPIVLSNVKLGDDFFREPTTFYVSDFDKSIVTIKTVLNPLYDLEFDKDEEIITDRNTQKEFTLSRKKFEELLEPENFTGADFSSASRGMGGGGGI